MKKYIPENIDLGKLIDNFHRQNIKEFHPDKLIWILSEIAEKPIASSGYAEIHSKRFKSFLHNYREYLEQLAENGIIERDLSFSHELYKKVRGYKFSDQYSSSIKGIEINYLPIVKKTAREKDNKIKSCRQNKHLVRWFNPGLSIDYDLAVDYLGTYFSEKKKEQESMIQREKIIRNKWFKNYSEKIIALQQCKSKDFHESYNRAFMAVDRLSDHEYHLSTDATVNRFYSVITTMPADFRNFLSYDGKELICLDIRNSQAYFSLNLFKEENIGEIITIAKEMIKKDSKLYNTKSRLPTNYPSSSIILAESLQRVDSQEFERFKTLVLSGKIYGYFERIMKDEVGIDYPSRKALKEEFFRVIYSSNRFLGQPAAAPKRAFQKHFPGISEYFAQLKKLYTDIIPIILMRWESHAVLQCITKMISKDHPEVPLFTIHDGIVTTNEHAGLVSTIICETLKDLTGYLPALKKEEWNIKNLKYYEIWMHKQQN